MRSRTPIRRMLVSPVGAIAAATLAVGTVAVSGGTHAARKHNPFVVALNPQPLPPGRQQPEGAVTLAAVVPMPNCGTKCSAGQAGPSVITLAALQVPPDPCRSGCLGDGSVHGRTPSLARLPQQPPDPCRGCADLTVATFEVPDHRGGGDPSTAHKSPGRNKYV